MLFHLLLVGASADAVGDGVGGAVAKRNGPRHPRQGAVGLAGVAVGGEGIRRRRVGASTEHIARQPVHVRVADHHAVLPVGHIERERLRLGRRPRLANRDRHGHGQDTLQRGGDSLGDLQIEAHMVNTCRDKGYEW